MFLTIIFVINLRTQTKSFVIAYKTWWTKIRKTVFIGTEMQRLPTIFKREMAHLSQVKMVGERGSGAGKGGGGGGSIRDAGGAFGKMGAAREDQYFHNLQKEQLRKLKANLHDEIQFHEEAIKKHEDRIKRHKEEIDRHDEEINNMKKEE